MEQVIELEASECRLRIWAKTEGWNVCELVKAARTVTLGAQEGNYLKKHLLACFSDVPPTSTERFQNLLDLRKSPIG